MEVISSIKSSRREREDTNSGSLPEVGRYRAMWIDVAYPGTWRRIGRKAGEVVGRGVINGSNSAFHITIVPP